MPSKIPWLLLVLALWPATAAAQGSAPTEYQVKAAFLFNFAKFVEWPESAFAGADGRLRLCVLGEDPFGAELDRMVAGKSVQGRQLAVERPSVAADARRCHVLFLAVHAGELRGVLGSLKGASVLTVGESPQFARHGGTIGLLLEEGRVRFEVNLDAAERAQLRVSSKLLALAKTVYSGHVEGGQ